MVADILRLMGQPFDKKILEELIEEVDADSKFGQSKNHTVLLANPSLFLYPISTLSLLLF